MSYDPLVCERDAPVPGDKCQWCRGTGSNRAEYGPVKCPDCNGTGYTPERHAEEDEEAQETAD